MPTCSDDVRKRPVEAYRCADGDTRHEADGTKHAGSAYHHYCPGRACESELNERTVHTGQSRRGRQEGVGRDAAITTWPSRARRGYVRISRRIIVGEKEHRKEEVLRWK